MKTQGNVSGDAINSPSEKPVRTRSRFPSLSYHFFNTERFGEYNSCFVMDCVEGDKVPIRSGGRVQSYSLKAPLMQSIFKKKDFYMVPMEAILPINWQKFYTNPTVGDDVSYNVGTGVHNFWRQVPTSINVCFNYVSTILGSTDPALNKINAILRCLVYTEYFYSSGSLLESLGCSGHRYARIDYNASSHTFDTYFDLVISTLIQNIPYFSFMHDGMSYTVVNAASADYMRSSMAVVPFRTYLQMLRDDMTTWIYDIGTVSESQITSWFKDYFDNSIYVRQFVYADVNYDLRRLWAYQLVCSHFYSNDHIDYIYSADLYRSLIDYFCFSKSDGTYVPYTFTLNGIKYQYDSMSSYVFTDMLGKLQANIGGFLEVDTSAGVAADFYRCLLGYFSSLFSYRRSLRYVDYFTGARSRPLAVGDVNINVNSNLVNVVDVSRNIQRQRFFNAVNRFGRRFEEYIKGLSGITPSVDYHNPLYLAHVSDSVYGVEVENTGAAQQASPNSITSRFMSNGSRYQFEFEVDRPCVVIGMSYYDMPRAYIDSTERQLFYLDRFDMFNPYMQFIGDQEVNYAELGSEFVYGGAPTFGYQLRHMEYKQRYDQAAGGFIESLPGFLFTDKEFGSSGFLNINPSFIRSFNSELDNFYVSLTGFSLGHYFHFIADNDNVCDASRPMAYAPSIL